MSRIQIKVIAIVVYSWRVGKAVYCCAGAVQSVVQVVVLVLGERLIYNGHGRAMGLAGALGMRQARPCYWSQTKLFSQMFLQLLKTGNIQVPCNNKRAQGGI